MFKIGCWIGWSRYLPTNSSKMPTKNNVKISKYPLNFLVSTIISAKWVSKQENISLSRQKNIWVLQMNELTGTKLLKFKFLCQTKAHHKCTQTSNLWVSITLDIWKRSYDGIGGAAFKKDLPFVSKKLENFKILLLIDFLFDCMLLNLGLESIEILICTFCTLFR